jgi:acyl carrier protein
MPIQIENISKALAKALDGRHVANLTFGAKLRDDLGLDSVTSLIFLMALEEFIEGFTVDPESIDISDLDSIQTVAHYVERQLARK